MIIYGYCKSEFNNQKKKYYISADTTLDIRKKWAPEIPPIKNGLVVIYSKKNITLDKYLGFKCEKVCYGKGHKLVLTDIIET